MNGRHAICLVVDGLRASALGTYGNTTSPTPELDALASRSAVVDWLWSDSIRLESFYRNAWSGVHAARREIPSDQSSVLEILKEDGVELRLITDESSLSEQSMFNQFDRTKFVQTLAEQPAEQIADTAMAHLCTATVEQLELWQADGVGSLAWVHLQGLFGPWDAPRSLRASLLDEEDPTPAEFLYPPELMCNVEDPDELLIHRAAYSAQVAVVDACLGALCQAIEEIMADRETLLIVCGSRGFALGEHGSIGSKYLKLYGEQLHLPWLLHVCDDQTPQPRLAGLAQPADVGATLLDWFGNCPDSQEFDGKSVLPAVESGDCTLREVAVAEGEDGELSIRTPAWFLRKERADAQPQLFAKADDRWECNDVAVRCPQIVDRLLEVFADFKQRCRDGRQLPSEALEEDLVLPVR